MRTLLMCALVVILFSSTVFANIYKLDVKTSYENKKQTKSSHTTVMAKTGKSFIIPFDQKDSFKFKMELSQNAEEIKQISPDSILSETLLVKAIVSINENGKEKVIGRPEILTRIGKEALFQTSLDNGEKFELKITPTVEKKL